MKGLKEHIWIEGVRRELHFWASARLDGLLNRTEEFGKKTIQTYDGSKDNVIYRSVSYYQGELHSDSLDAYRKMAEKFKPPGVVTPAGGAGYKVRLSAVQCPVPQLTPLPVFPSNIPDWRS